ncbi:MAG: hypothetical protein FWE67_15280 [Planctomycetaceae bacterium]|nr:hypothetical protein [Planctomycetaceae bacterium]
MSGPVFLSNGIIKLGESEGIAPEKTKYPVKVTLLSGEKINNHWLGHWESGDFIIELSSATFNETVIANYNHNPEEIIGIGRNIRIEGNALVCDGEIIPYRPKDRAEEIVYRAKNGTPFEASIEFTETPESCLMVNKGDSVLVDGREWSGPINVYRNVQVRAFAICPLGCDSGTHAAFLSTQRKKENEMPVKTDAKKAEQSAKTSAAPGKLSEGESGGDGSKYPELDELQSMFGDELGVTLFKDGVALEEAKKVFEFNEKYGIVPKPDTSTDEELSADPPADENKAEPKEDTAGLKAEVAKLAAENSKLHGEFAKLSAALTAKAEPDGVGQTFSQTKPEEKEKTYAEITAERLSAMAGRK